MSKLTGARTPEELLAFLDWVDTQIEFFSAGYEGGLTLRASELRAAARRGLVLNCDRCGQPCPEPHRSPGGVLLLCVRCLVRDSA